MNAFRHDVDTALPRRAGLIRRRCFLEGSLFAAGAALAQGGVLTAGAARRRITPPLSVPYLTSSGKGTYAPFDAVRDDLSARALVLDDGGAALAVLAVDSIGYDNCILGPGRDFTAELRRRIASATGLRPERIMLCATHSHSTPETIGLTPVRTVDGVSEWIERHLEQLAATVTDAWRLRAPARIRASEGRLEGIARYRRIRLKNGRESRRGPLPRPEDVAVPWELDEQLSVLGVERADGAPLAVLMNFTAHPIITSPLPQVSADFPGVACSMIEREMPGAVCLFLQGAAGNVNPLCIGGVDEDLQRIGGRLGRSALKLVKQAPLLPSHSIAHRSIKVRLEPRDVPSGDDRALQRMRQKLAEDTLVVEVQAMRVGPVSWVSLPGEAFVETGLALKKAGASFVVGYANGWHGYFPIRRAYPEGGYEVNPGVWSRVAAGSAERLEAAGIELVKQLR